MPVKMVAVTLASVFIIMLGSICTIIGLVKEKKALLIVGIVLAALSVIAFAVVFFRTLAELRRQDKQNEQKKQ